MRTLLREAAHDDRLEGSDQRSRTSTAAFDINKGLRTRAQLPPRRASSSACRRAPSSSIRSRRSSSPTSSRGAPSARARPRARCIASSRPASRCRSASRTAPRARVQIAVDAVGARDASAPFPLGDEAGARRDRRDEGQPRLPRHPARRREPAELQRRARRAARSTLLEKAGLAPRVMIDCSHANSGKDHEKQPHVADERRRADRRRQRARLRRDARELPRRRPSEPGARTSRSSTDRASPTRA